LHHYIGTTHVVHHIFSDLPHYNAKEATIYLKQVLGPLHNEDSKNIVASLMASAQMCAVEHKGDGVWKFK
jgi:omega-6 fatty acid desaturase (delta-12 desaturase)